MAKKKVTEPNQGFSKALVKKHLPDNWYIKYVEKCALEGMDPKSYTHMNSIKNGRFENVRHYSILIDLATGSIENEIRSKEILMTSSRKLEEVNNGL